jgi:hypothetical protein
MRGSGNALLASSEGYAAIQTNIGRKALRAYKKGGASRREVSPKGYVEKSFPHTGLDHSQFFNYTEMQFYNDIIRTDIPCILYSTNYLV